MGSFSQSLSCGNVRSWYQTEQNTGRLIRAVFGYIGRDDLSGDAIWRLLTLTWITVHDGEATNSHWRKYKVPALAFLFGIEAPDVRENLSATLKQMTLPEDVRQAADCDTGMINYRGVWRNSSQLWCQKNVIALRTLLSRAYRLSSDDLRRFELAAEVAKLKEVPSPGGKVTVGADNTLTPLLACLDPKRRFPVVNAREGVKQLLRSLGLARGSLPVQVEGLVGVIGQWGIPDAFALDVLSDEIAKKGRALQPPVIPPECGDDGGSKLRKFDEAERKSTTKSRTTIYRNRHRKITNALDRIFGKEKLNQGKNRRCLFDVLFKNYDKNGRDLLIEVKPDPDKGSVRIAVGQLLDYRRFLPNRAGTDLALLTITRPPEEYVDLLFGPLVNSFMVRGRSLHQTHGCWKGMAELGRPEHQGVTGSVESRSDVYDTPRGRR